MEVGGFVRKCFYSGNITLKSSSGTISGVSGIVGFSNTKSSIVSCYNRGNITNESTYNWSRVAGIDCGIANVFSCYNSGEILMKKGNGYTDNKCNAGGIFSNKENKSIGSSVHNCINFGSVSVENFTGENARVRRNWCCNRFFRGCSKLFL